MSKSRYSLDRQIGFLMRRANQRHLGIFSAHISELTPMQFAAFAKLAELGVTSQNQLGRDTAMDAATIKGVIDRLASRGWVTTKADVTDKRRRLVELSAEGEDLWAELVKLGHDITRETLAPLSKDEQADLLRLIAKLI